LNSCAELHKPKSVRGSQAKKIIFKAFFGPDLVLAIFRFLAQAFKLLGIGINIFRVES